MFEIIFNEISAAELAALPKPLQLELVSEFQLLPELPPQPQTEPQTELQTAETTPRRPDELKRQPDANPYGTIERDGKQLWRFRTSDYRIYFERHPTSVIVHRILHKNTIRDFLFRSGLPMTDEDEVRHVKAFWELIEEGDQPARP